MESVSDIIRASKSAGHEMLLPDLDLFFRRCDSRRNDCFVSDDDFDRRMDNFRMRILGSCAITTVFVNSRIDSSVCPADCPPVENLADIEASFSRSTATFWLRSVIVSTIRPSGLMMWSPCGSVRAKAWDFTTRLWNSSKVSQSMSVLTFLIASVAQCILMSCATKSGTSRAPYLQCVPTR